jgi:hypothetical protein
MVEVTLNVANEDVQTLLDYVTKQREALTDDMIAANDSNPKTRKATTVYVMLGPIAAQLKAFQIKLARLEEEAKKRK